MRSALSIYSRILQLDVNTFSAIRASHDRIWFALRLFVIVTLIAALGKWALLGSLLDQPTLPEIARQIAELLDQVAAFLPDWLGFLAAFLHDISKFVLELETLLASLAPPIGVRPSRIVLLLGQWLSAPFNLMALWLPFALMAMGVAKLLGGRGSLTQHLSLVALAIAPYVLSMLHNAEFSSLITTMGVGIAGRALALVGVVWSAAILVRAVAVAHDFTPWRSMAALLIAFITLYVLIPLATTLAFTYILFG